MIKIKLRWKKKYNKDDKSIYIMRKGLFVSVFWLLVCEEVYLFF